MKRLLLPMLLLLAVTTQAQGPRKGMLRTQGTVSIGLSKPETRYYVYGEFEGMLSDHIGLNGAAYGCLGSNNNPYEIFFSPPFADDFFIHSSLAGPIYHFLPDQPLDLYLGVQPGFSLVQHNYLKDASGAGATEWDVVPTASALGGVAYYGSFFHLFAQARYVHARYSSIHSQYPLSDLRLAIGLGFNLHTMKMNHPLNED